MPPVPLILARRRNRTRQPFSRKVGAGCALLLTAALALLGMTLAFAYAYVTADLPSIESISLLLDPRSGLPTRMYDRSGKHLLLSLQNPAAVNAPPLSADPQANDHYAPALITLTIGVEDPRFWQHPGFTLPGQPPSLAQRLVRTLLLSNEPPGFRRALRERLLAAQLTARYGRQQILTWYLNSADYGRLAFGANAAAHVYLGKSARDLTLAEAALLTAIAQTPSINPFDAPTLAQAHAQELLRNLQRDGLLSPAETRTALQQDIRLVEPAAPPPSPAPAFARHALQEAAAIIGWEKLQRGGYTIRTTLDYNLQLQVQCAAQAYLARLHGQPPAAEMLTFDGKPCEAARLISSSTLTEAPSQAALSTVVLDPKSGEILTWMDTTPEEAYSPLEAGRPPGTLLTPLVYLTGFTRGFAPASLVWDIPSGEGPPLLDSSYEGPLRLRNALANDDLPPAVQVFYQVGAENVWRTAARLGLHSLVESTSPQPDLLWQGGRLNLLEATQAFATLATGGTQYGARSGESLHPVAILEIRDRAGNTVYTAQTQSQPVLTSGLAYLLTNILQDEPARWRTLGHPNPLEIGRPVAAKTGQTLDHHDAWSIGYTPYLSTGVWLGDLRSTEHGNALPAAAAAFWHAVMQYASRSYPAEAWQRPPEISLVQVCDPSGMLPTAECPAVVTEVFLNGTEPTHADTLFRKIAINRETGLRATVSTPPELVEERTYLIVPPEAASWAQQAGLPTPPEAYDILAPQAAASPEVRIDSPSNFTYVNGEVRIVGTATGADFATYRLQVGAGLNPQTWIQVGDTHTAPVEDGLLGIWDTSKLEGVYAIQLLVSHKDQRIETAVVQVTVDNQPPEVHILGLEDGESISQRERPTMLFQVEAQDNLSIAEVRFVLNGQEVGSRSQAPWQVPWKTRAGNYTLEVQAIDSAGNRTVARVQFQVTR